jgi:DNA ligase D-like protein (predicted 3'-phosphoesterase)
MPSFVVQKHDASTLHYDFRLEVDHVFKSWAVPKGPSTNPSDKRLAVPVEDHPLSWGDFEGVIESGYGKGTVIVWDRGRYENLRDVPMAQALEEGHAVFRLDGEKLRGAWALTRVAAGKDERWLLVKKNDDEADREHDVTRERPESVVSGRTIEGVADAK